MIKTILTFLLLLLQCISYAQAGLTHTACYTELPLDTNSKVFTKVPYYPQFKDGEKAWLKFVARNFWNDSLYKLFRDRSIVRDSVVVQFIVRRDGGISNLKTITGAHEFSKEEARRLLRLSCPYWLPAVQSSGVQVTAWFHQTFIFEINEEAGKLELKVR